ncbi:MAG: response regulator [Eubacteriales bacterium]|nr:response regulator [Eubacteriales bacterium]
MDRKLRILLAEDEPLILRSVKRGIERFGKDYEVVAEAYDGQEALRLIKEEKPDLVVTDIVMPLVDGLELIEEAKKEGAAAKFLLLSGYEKFEYAQKAVAVGAVKYLLKPVDFAELQKCLEEIEAEIYRERRKAEKAFLTELCSGGRYPADLGDSDEKRFYFVIAVIGGCLGRSGFEKPFWEFGESAVGSFSEKFEKEIYQIPGHYPNELFFVVPSGVPKWKRISELAEAVAEEFRADGRFLTVCYCDEGRTGAELPKQIREMHCEIPFRLVFGKNTVFRFSGKEIPLEGQAGDTVRDAVTRLNLAVTREESERILAECARRWEREGMTQMQLQAELRYLFGHLAVPGPEDVVGFLYGVCSYGELVEKLGRVLYPESRKLSAKGKMLAEAVKAYLDVHFTEEISYKEFGRIFGYHEKYLTMVFKENVGVSPNRYVTEKRIEMAKGLLRMDGELLLKEIAERVGYTDPLYFSRVFKNVTGMSPKMYGKCCCGEESWPQGVRESGWERASSAGGRETGEGESGRECVSGAGGREPETV